MNVPNVSITSFHIFSLWSLWNLDRYKCQRCLSFFPLLFRFLYPSKIFCKKILFLKVDKFLFTWRIMEHYAMPYRMYPSITSPSSLLFCTLPTATKSAMSRPLMNCLCNAWTFQYWQGVEYPRKNDKLQMIVHLFKKKWLTHSVDQRLQNP